MNPREELRIRHEALSRSILYLQKISGDVINLEPPHLVEEEQGDAFFSARLQLAEVRRRARAAIPAIQEKTIPLLEELRQRVGLVIAIGERVEEGLLKEEDFDRANELLFTKPFVRSKEPAKSLFERRPALSIPGETPTYVEPPIEVETPVVEIQPVDVEEEGEIRHEDGFTKDEEVLADALFAINESGTDLKFPFKRDVVISLYPEEWGIAQTQEEKKRFLNKRYHQIAKITPTALGKIGQFQNADDETRQRLTHVNKFMEILKVNPLFKALSFEQLKRVADREISFDDIILIARQQLPACDLEDLENILGPEKQRMQMTDPEAVVLGNSVLQKHGSLGILLRPRELARIEGLLTKRAHLGIADEDKKYIQRSLARILSAYVASPQEILLRNGDPDVQILLVSLAHLKTSQQIETLLS